MRAMGIFLFLFAGLCFGSPELNLSEAADYGYATFNACGPKDNCVELPDVPYAWRFIPEFMGFRKFTPVGAIRKDWNDWWLSRKRGWWDWSNGIGDGQVNYGLNNGYGRPYSFNNGSNFGLNGANFPYNYRRSIGNPHPGYPNWQRARYNNDNWDD